MCFEEVESTWIICGWKWKWLFLTDKVICFETESLKVKYFLLRYSCRAWILCDRREKWYLIIVVDKFLKFYYKLCILNLQNQDSHLYECVKFQFFTFQLLISFGDSKHFQSFIWPINNFRSDDPVSHQFQH